MLLAKNYSCSLSVFNMTTGGEKWVPHPPLLKDCAARSGTLDSIAVPPFAAFLTDLDWLIVLVPSLSPLKELALYAYDFKVGIGRWEEIAVAGSYILPSISYGLAQLTTAWPTVSSKNGAYLLSIDAEGFKVFSLQVSGGDIETGLSAQVNPCEPNHFFFGLPNCAFTSSSPILPLSTSSDTFIAAGLSCNNYHSHEHMRVGIFQEEPGALWSIPYLTQPAPPYGRDGLESPFSLIRTGPLEGYTTAMVNDVAIIFGGAPTRGLPSWSHSAQDANEGTDGIWSSNSNASFSGITVDTAPVNDTWCYNSEELKWYRYDGTVPAGRTYHSAAASVFDQIMYVYGGYNETHSLAELWMLKFTDVKTCRGA